MKFGRKFKKKQKRKKTKKKKKVQLYDLNNRIKDLDRRHNNMDRRIFLNNPLNSEDYQRRCIEFQDRRYQEAREELEKEKKKIMS